MDFNMFDNSTPSAPFNAPQNTQPVQPQVPKAYNPDAHPTLDNLTYLSQMANQNTDYTDDQWKEREAIYVTECNRINVDYANLTSNEIIVAAGRIDALLTPLRIDDIYCTKLSTINDTKLKVEKERNFNIVKRQAQTKLTEAETKSAVTTVIAKTPIQGNDTLYDLCIRYSSRAIFTNGMIKCLTDKKDLLITYSGMLKIENSVTNFQQSVPTGGQMNRMAN